MSLSPFTKHWIAATLAPDSIRTVKENKDSSLFVIRNEQSTIFIFVLEHNTLGVIAYGKNFEDIKQHRAVTDSEMTSILANEFGLQGFKTNLPQL